MADLPVGIFGLENACYWCQCPREDHGCYMDRDMWEEEFDPDNAEHRRRHSRGTVWVRPDGSSSSNDGAPT